MVANTIALVLGIVGGVVGAMVSPKLRVVLKETIFHPFSESRYQIRGHDVLVERTSPKHYRHRGATPTETAAPAR